MFFKIYVVYMYNSCIFWYYPFLLYQLLLCFNISLLTWIMDFAWVMIRTQMRVKPLLVFYCCRIVGHTIVTSFANMQTRFTTSNRTYHHIKKENSFAGTHLLTSGGPYWSFGKQCCLATSAEAPFVAQKQVLFWLFALLIITKLSYHIFTLSKKHTSVSFVCCIVVVARSLNEN